MADTTSPYLVTLQQEIQSANAARAKPLSPEDVAGIVRQVIGSLQGDVSAADLKFYTELEDLARYIRQAKQEIAAIKPEDISTDFIPNATDELDAVVGATEEATNSIMDVCDTISSVADTCSEDVKEKLISCTTRIYEACNFQDVTGQRITKVVEALKHIDTKIEALVKAMGEKVNRKGGATTVEPVLKHIHATTATVKEENISGPSLPQDAISQDDIDKLLSGG